MSRTMTMESRPLDAVMDPTFASGGARTQPYVLASVSSDAAVSGSNRYAHHHHYRPRQPHLTAIAPEVLLAPRAVADPSVPVASMSGTVDVGTQSMYRESEAQTDPYTPEVTVDPAKPTPEVLMLEGMTFEHGLPAGLTEVKMVELARRRAEAEAAMPPTTDEASVQLRLVLLERLESSEFAAREADIDSFQAERLNALSSALAERDRANTFQAEVRVDMLRQDLAMQRDRKVAKVAQKRLTVMRKLGTARAGCLPNRLMRGFDGSSKHGNKDLVSTIADPSSTVYAPLRRDGAGLQGQALASRYDVSRVVAAPTSPEALKDFTSAAPVALRRPFIPQPRMAPEEVPHNPAARAEKHLRQALDVASKVLEREGAGQNGNNSAGGSSSSVGGGAGEGGGGEAAANELPAWFSKPQLDRPPTPEVADTSHDPASVAQEANAQAVKLLQRLLRGRALQNTLSMGLANRRELVAELRTQAPPGLALAYRHTVVADAALDAFSGGKVADALILATAPKPPTPPPTEEGEGKAAENADKAPKEGTV